MPTPSGGHSCLMRYPVVERFLPVRSLPTFFALLLAILPAVAQTGRSPQELIERVKQLAAENPGKHRAEIERLLYQALTEWRKQPGTRQEDFAEAAVMLALFHIGDGRSGDQVTNLVDEAIGVYEAASPRVEDGRLALALEAKAESLPGDPAAAVFRDRASAIRRALFDRRRAADEAGKPALESVGRVDHKTKAPSIEEKQEPAYTEAARIAKRQGAVSLTIQIDTEGKPRNITLLRSLGFGLDEAAYDAVRQWRFRPASRDGEPVPVEAKIEVNFRLL